MHINVLKLVYIHSELLQVSANHVAIFRHVKYKGLGSLKSTVWFTMLFTSRHFLLDGELLTETFCLYHPIKYQHILISNNLFMYF
jgi:hypothetical protein